MPNLAQSSEVSTVLTREGAKAGVNRLFSSTLQYNWGGGWLCSTSLPLTFSEIKAFPFPLSSSSFSQPPSPSSTSSLESAKLYRPSCKLLPLPKHPLQTKLSQLFIGDLLWGGNKICMCTGTPIWPPSVKIKAQTSRMCQPGGGSPPFPLT